MASLTVLECLHTSLHHRGVGSDASDAALAICPQVSIRPGAMSLPVRSMIDVQLSRLAHEGLIPMPWSLRREPSHPARARLPGHLHRPVGRARALLAVGRARRGGAICRVVGGAAVRGADPLDWYIEVCRVCGCQLGPGIGSRTDTGRCVIPEHRPQGGIVVRVLARHPIEQDDITRRFLGTVLTAPRASAPFAASPPESEEGGER